MQELNPVACNEDGTVCTCPEPPCQSIAKLHGVILLGMGCYCKDDFVEEDGVCEYADGSILGGRSLQGGDESALSSKGFEIQVTVARAPEPEPTDGGGDGDCGDFFLLRFVCVIIRFFASLFGG